MEEEEAAGARDIPMPHRKAPRSRGRGRRQAPGAAATALCLAALCVGPSPGVARATSSVANGLGHCFLQSHFLGDQSLRQVNFTVLRNVSASDFAVPDSLGGYGVFYSDVLEGNVDLDAVFASGVSAILTTVHFAGSEEPSEEEVLDLHSGSSFMHYTLDSSDKFFDFFKRGKYEYSETSGTVVLACVLPLGWQALDAGGADALLPAGVQLDVNVDVTNFERYAWNSTAYKFVFRYGFGLAFAALALECCAGLRDYVRFCTMDEVRVLFWSPIGCLTVNGFTAAVMSFVFVIDGWGSTGFLTKETFSAFVTLTLMTTMGTVLTMAVHWMTLRSMMAAATKPKDAGGKGGKGGAGAVDLTKRAKPWLYMLACACLSVDFFSFVYAKVLNQSMDRIWMPLLVLIGCLEFMSAIFFTKQANLFAEQVRSLVNANNLATSANLRFLRALTMYMRMCSYFLLLSVVATVLIGSTALRKEVALWNSLWGVAIFARLGISRTIVRTSFLNTTGHKQRSVRGPAVAPEAASNR